jgi:Ca2+-binding RTX toxin-like protein
VYDSDDTNAQNVITVNGGDGNDTITLTEGTDAVGTRNLNGEAGNDTITGSAGVDLITGGAGQDTMTGGADADIFHFASGASGITLATADTIVDFTTASDDLDVGTAGTYTEFLGTAQTEATFLVAAAAAFDGTGTDAYVSVNAADSGDAWVLVDMDADGTVSANDVFIVLTGINAVAEIITGDII